MFTKVGDLNPITIVDPVDIDNEITKKSLKKIIKTVKEAQKIIVPAQKKESEKK
jgi:hypothetical protein